MFDFTQAKLCKRKNREAGDQLDWESQSQNAFKKN